MQDILLVKMFLPEGIMNYFEVTNITKDDICYRIYMDENNLLPTEPEYISCKLSSKGFYEESTIQDFPIRGKASYLHIRRRRWLNETTGDYVCRDWEVVAKGTRITQEFATFLKEFIRHNAS